MQGLIETELTSGLGDDGVGDLDSALSLAGALGRIEYDGNPIVLDRWIDSGSGRKVDSLDRHLIDSAGLSFGHVLHNYSSDGIAESIVQLFPPLT